MAFNKRDKHEFVYKYRCEFLKLASVKTTIWYPKMNNSPVKKLIKYIANKARIEIGYSERTSDIDIVWLLHNYRF